MNELATDIGRFLDRLPVHAAPPSRLYRIRKLTSRHRVAVVASVALLVTFVAGAIGTTVAT